eukprot:CAMPEP_0176379522 /NCGR_PEP_ID=MMETSP0126-20121128/30415_1 /TAXON_ID=141414 ORGANISM="Strombidinopsis acuminatum, Strain SPMC142" /NCGR_SAMPLE_ID=MMETSP0126 /ASSEMBLY_ACC=CAM_ASM_000229 /LENGTH=80 /DNA_ID=CAMNT_0017742329 /DNA_START=1858 /DNA_END=2100 /DNA_ORIENTATION=+
MGHYVDFKKKQEEAKEAALTKVTNFDQDIRTFSTTNGVDLAEFRRRNGSISLGAMRSLGGTRNGRQVSSSMHVKGSLRGL